MCSHEGPFTPRLPHLWLITGIYVHEFVPFLILAIALKSDQAQLNTKARCVTGVVTTN
jgi:hypothetical protein